jgi:FkbM family methyltransferase
MGLFFKKLKNIAIHLVNVKFYKLLQIILLASVKGKNNPGKTKILGKKVTFSDAFSLIGMYNEIILQEIYRFETEKEKPVIIDCGANIGISILYFKSKYPNAVITAIEADPIIATILQNNLLNNNIQVEIIQKAIWSNSNELIQFGSSGDDSGSIFNLVNAKEVETIKLNDLFEKYEEVDLLKIDIEGAEIEALKNGNINLTKIKRAFVEFHSFPNRPQELEEILSVFSKQGFRYYIIPARKMNQPFMENHHLNQMDLQLNIFFIKNETIN